jgi:hypothetical protein
MPDAWGRLSEQYRAALPLKEPALNIQIYAGVGHAVSEVTKALAKLYTHKKMIAVIEGVDPTFNKVAVAFSEEGFIVKSMSVTEATRAETWTPLMDELLFVLTSVDDPVTGRLYPLESAAFTGKRIVRIHVSHEAHRHEPMKRPDPFVANILSLTPDRALMVAGERVKIEPQIAPSLHWIPESLESLDDIRKNLRSQSTDFRSDVIKFESDLPSGFRAYFKADDERLFDRTVIYHPDFDGSAVIDELSQTMQIQIARPGEVSPLETTSACRWESPRFNEWLLSRGETDSTTRGLVMISSDLIKKGLRVHLETAAAKITRLQNGGSS